MKKLLAYMLCFALLLCGALAEEEETVPAAKAPGEALGFELLRELYVPGENCVLSPRSLVMALAMAAEGAQGETLAEILAALGVDDVSALAGSEIEGLKSANAAFTAPGLVLKQDYADRLNALYAAEWFEIDGEVVEKVNGWVEENTDGLIDELLSDAPAADTGMILLNAVAMDAQWSTPFSTEATEDADFHAPGGDVTVEMMRQKEYFDYAEKDGMQIVRLPYSTGNLEMWVVLPEEGGMEALLEILANEGMFYLKSDAQSREVILSMPKLDVTDENTLTGALKLLGMEQAFSDHADFSGMSDVPMCIDDVLQKARIQVDEQGTKAAAATALLMRAMAMAPVEEPVEMNVNRPFVFVVSDAETGGVCFAGAIENPTEN